jgi:hypothetical protein
MQSSLFRVLGSDLASIFEYAGAERFTVLSFGVEATAISENR